MRKSLLFFLIVTIQLYAQNWSNIITTQINEPNLVKMEMFSNKDGLHLVVQNSNSTNSLKYYLLNSNGAIVRSSIIETQGGSEFPNITGDNNKIFIVYKLGNYLKTKYTTNAGQNWNTNISPLQIGNNLCNGVDIIYGNNNLHLVYATQDNYPYYKTHYYRLNELIGNWEDYKNVTDLPNEVGGFPSIAISNDTVVLVSYNSGPFSDPVGNFSIEKTRAKYGNTWLAPQTVTFNNESSARAKVHFVNGHSFIFYYEPWSDLGSWGYHLIVKNKPDLLSSWSGHTQLTQYTSNPRMLVGAEKTANNNLNIVYDDMVGKLYFRYYDGYNWSNAVLISNENSNVKQFAFSVTSNDLFVVWKEETNNYLQLRHYDAQPLTPTNFTVTPYNGKPKLSWSLNNEPDVRINNSGYKIERRLDPQGSGQWSSWTHIASVSGQVNEFLDNSISGAGSGPSYAQYRIRAQDIGGNYSNYTSSATINYGNGLEKRSFKNYSFDLIGNYPNPFNPETKIVFTLPESGDAELVFYNIVGEVLSKKSFLNLDAGEHQYSFNANELSLNSGIYFYELKFKNHYKLGKMVLMK